ncbi:hydroxyacylglutathione hydrolase [Cupriavidus gilardii CR3]|nr:hydroxyacylglutathione hydrolase [Cupriavidus gilardii CR3]
MLRVEPIPAFQDNYIWAIDDGHAAAVVDPGDAAPVLAYLARTGLVLGAIVITHHHGDHQGGVADLLAAYPAGPDGEPMPVIGPAAERIGHRTRAVREGDEVELKAPALRLRVLDVPGHTAGHIAYTGELPGIGPVVFCGDTMFASGCGGCSRARRRRCWLRSTSWPHCPTRPASIVPTSIRAAMCASPARSSRTTPRWPLGTSVSRRCVPPASPPCRPPSAMSGRSTPSCARASRPCAGRSPRRGAGRAGGRRCRGVRRAARLEGRLSLTHPRLDSPPDLPRGRPRPRNAEIRLTHEPLCL